MIKQFQYKAWANSELLEKIKLIDKENYPEQWLMAIRLLNHTLVVDRIFIAHITGESHSFSATNTPETPTHDELSDAIQKTDNWLIQYTNDLTESILNETRYFTFTDGDSGRMLLSEILNHLIIHGAYHRGNVGMLLTAAGIDKPNDTFTRFLHQIEPDRRLKI